LKIAVTGASGFVGRNLIDLLKQTNHDIRALIHRSKIESPENKLEFVSADVHDLDTLINALKGVDVVYHLVGIIAETRRLTFEKTVTGGTKNLVEACARCGVGKIIYLSALGTSPDAKTKYHKSKWQSEESVRNSGVRFVILRPSIIFGPEDKSINTFVSMVKISPVIPIVGDGRYLMQPIFIDDLVHIMLDFLDNARAEGRTIEIGGPEQLQFKQIIAIIKKVLKRQRWRLYIPAWLVKPVAVLMEKIIKPAPITGEQIEMLLAGNICDNYELNELIDIKLMPLEDGLRKYLR
jgi:NADH dehydrogenase